MEGQKVLPQLRQGRVSSLQEDQSPAEGGHVAEDKGFHQSVR